MLRQIYIFECEDIKERMLFNFHRKFIEFIENPSVLVIQWTSEDEGKLVKYKDIIKNYFNELGVKNIFFLAENDKKASNKFENSNILYLPGGDTKCFFKKIKKNSWVIKKIKNFRGLVIGNSAGAIVLSKKGYSYDKGVGKINEYNGLNILNAKIFVHFKPEYFSLLKKGDIIILEDNNAVTFIK